MKSYHSKNFHKHTFCLWKEVSLTDFELEKSNFKSKSGSEYYFTEEGVYRSSNHWGRAANCRWRLIALENYKSQQTRIGFANWTDFYPNDETSKLFFIQVDFEKKTVDFFHKDSKEYDEKAVLRTAGETAKAIKTIKEILTETAWSKHLNFDDLEVLRREIVKNIIQHGKSLREAKLEFL